MVNCRCFGYYDEDNEIENPRTDFVSDNKNYNNYSVSCSNNYENNYDNLQRNSRRAGLGSTNHGAAGQRPTKFGSFFSDGQTWTKSYPWLGLTGQEWCFADSISWNDRGIEFADEDK